VHNEWSSKFVHSHRKLLEVQKYFSSAIELEYMVFWICRPSLSPVSLRLQRQAAVPTLTHDRQCSLLNHAGLQYRMGTEPYAPYRLE